MGDSFLTIEKHGQATFKDRNSRFIGHVFPASNEAEIKEIQSQLKKEYFDARHHCYAYILGFKKEISRSNDDGEPSGSAGKPIFNQLLSHDVTNILAVVIRYFGGTKLGVPGLINAYKTATKMALSETNIIEKYMSNVLHLEFSYPEISKVMNINCAIRISFMDLITSKLKNAGVLYNVIKEDEVF